MSRLCQLTGAKPSFSASVSHGKGRSRRRWARTPRWARTWCSGRSGEPPRPRGPARPAAAITARVKAWVRAELDDDDPRSVMITELACTEPGCPPLETVIALLGPGDQTQHKIHKPLAEVTEPEVIGALRGDSHCT